MSSVVLGIEGAEQVGQSVHDRAVDDLHVDVVTDVLESEHRPEILHLDDEVQKGTLESVLPD